ncbi:hypothetical protein [Catenulispora rubra]|uniref:hypothetical protein n=1 Tax=Catenulispora rubra TaxID=280293 RepID=UPI0018925D81|nr:hypothetical protein [Catenulispora rubra]
MSALAVLALVAAVMFVVIRERRIYKRNKAWHATAVQVVAPPPPRWWQPLLANLVVGALIAAAVLALLRYTPGDGTTPGPATPLDGGTDGTGTPNPASPTYTPTSHSSPNGGSR